LHLRGDSRLFDIYEEALKMDNPANVKVLLAAAHDAAISRDFSRAEELLTRVLATHPHEISAWDLLGFVLFFQDRPAEAEDACRRALAIEPNHAYAKKGLGLCLSRQGRLDEGVAFLLEAIRLMPSWFDPRWDLAVVLADAGRLDEATEVLREAEQAIPQQRERFAAMRARLEARTISSP
jgi:Flp pilus assembly protein TadD